MFQPFVLKTKQTHANAPIKNKQDKQNKNKTNTHRHNDSPQTQNFENKTYLFCTIIDRDQKRN